MNGSRVLPPSRSKLPAAGVVLVVVVLTALLAVSGGASADDKLKHRQRDVQGQVRSAQGDLEDASADVRAAQAKLTSSRTALLRSQTRLAKAQKTLVAAEIVDAQMQARLQAAEASLAEARVALDRAKQAVLDQRREVGELAASNYANGDPALMGLSAILNSQDIEGLTTQLNTVTALMSKQTVLLDRLRDARARTVTEEAKVADATAAVAVQRKAAAANLVRTQALESSAQAARADYAAMVTRNRAAQAAALKARTADLRELRALKREQQRIRQLIIERAAKQRGGFKGDADGFLYRPVSGYVTSPFGYRIHPIYHYYGLHDGTDFHAPCGTPMRAAGTGTVITRTYSSVYGNRLYLDLGQVNGKNMTVVYNHATSYTAGTGQSIKRGEVLGYAGSTGWSTGCHLHFTVLLDGSPVNPEQYL